MINDVDLFQDYILEFGLKDFINRFYISDKDVRWIPDNDLEYNYVSIVSDDNYFQYGDIVNEWFLKRILYKYKGYGIEYSTSQETTKSRIGFCFVYVLKFSNKQKKYLKLFHKDFE